MLNAIILLPTAEFDACLGDLRTTIPGLLDRIERAAGDGEAVVRRAAVVCAVSALGSRKIACGEGVCGFVLEQNVEALRGIFIQGLNDGDWIVKVEVLQSLKAFAASRGHALLCLDILPTLLEGLSDPDRLVRVRYVYCATQMVGLIL